MMCMIKCMMGKCIYPHQNANQIWKLTSTNGMQECSFWLSKFPLLLIDLQMFFYVNQWIMKVRMNSMNTPTILSKRQRDQRMPNSFMVVVIMSFHLFYVLQNLTCNTLNFKTGVIHITFIIYPWHDFCYNLLILLIVYKI